jgi:RNA polymerase sigma-70 factor, ECF subfamily
MTPDPTELEVEFLKLLTRHKYELFNLIFCIVPSLADAEDVFQQTTLAIWSNFRQFRPGSDFMAWAGQVARYRAWNFARSRRRERICFSQELISEMAEAAFESTEIQEARMQALAGCREKLSTADQNLITLCYGGQTIREAAEQIGRPVRAVHNSLSRIRRALYECIERTLAQGERA